MAGLEGSILDRYELERLIGRGGMADVYAAYDPRFDRTVAVKVFKRDDEDLLRRFIREARLMASLRNPHLVPIYDTGESSLKNIPYYYIVMPLMEGGTLRAKIRNAPLPLSEASRNLNDIADGLDYIHGEGIIHRDIKSSNVLLDAEGRCYLSDFGIARLANDSTQMTSTGNVLGTVDYIAPELFEANGKATTRSDLYSLGVLLYEMVTGRLPFTAENQIALVSMHVNQPPPPPRNFRPGLSPLVERVVLRALEKRPEQRYNNATQLAEAFSRAVNGQGDLASLMPAPLDEPATVRDMQVSSVHQEPLVLPPAEVDSPPPVPVTPPYSQQSWYPPQNGGPMQTGGYNYNQYGPMPGEYEAEHNRRPWIVGIMAFLILLLLSAALVYAFANPFTSGKTGDNTNPTATTAPTSTPTAAATPNLTATAQVNAAHATATAEANVHATATARANATATAVANATATAQAQASATPGVLQTAIAGTPIYQDSLNNADNPATKSANWDNDGTHCVFATDGYHVKENVGLTNLRGCHEAANTYQNTATTVDMQILSGHSGGLVIRLTPDLLGNFTGYLLEVDTKGNYKVSRFSGNPTILQDWTPTTALKQGSNKNTLQIIARDSTLLFYINGVFLVGENDSSYQSGGIGFLATLDSNPADVVFSNLRIYPQP